MSHSHYRLGVHRKLGTRFLGHRLAWERGPRGQDRGLRKGALDQSALDLGLFPAQNTTSQVHALREFGRRKLGRGSFGNAMDPVLVLLERWADQVFGVAF